MRVSCTISTIFIRFATQSNQRGVEPAKVQRPAAAPVHPERRAQSDGRRRLRERRAGDDEVPRHLAVHHQPAGGELVRLISTRDTHTHASNMLFNIDTH